MTSFGLCRTRCPFAFCAVIGTLFAFSVQTAPAAPPARENAGPQSSQPGVATEGNRTAALFPPDFFPILPWGVSRLLTEDDERRSGLASIAECHFTIAGFVNPKDLPACERLGLAAIVRPDHNLGRPREGLRTQTQIQEQVRRLVASCGQSPALLGYYVRDEPGVSDFPHLAFVVQAIKEHAPGKLAYINLFPGYATLGAVNTSQLETDSYHEYLERFVRVVKPQFLSYDNYSVQYSQDLKDPAKAARYYADLIEVRRVALEHDLPFWNVVSSNQIRPFTTIPSPANMLFQAYTTLAAGGRGVSWYTYYARKYGYAPIDDRGRRTTIWSYLAMVNRQLKTLGPIMNRLTSTGVFFTAPPPVESLPRLPGRVIQEVDTNVPLMIGEFRSDEGVDHVMVVNLSLENSAHFVLKRTDGRTTAQVFSPEDGSTASQDLAKGLWLAAGQGALFRL
jgi:hypothetical protein